MIIKSKYLGEVEIDTSKIIDFNKGIPGFVDSKKFVLLDIEEDNPLKILQDINHEYIAFFIVNPWNFYIDYDIQLPREELKSIGIDDDNKKNIDIYSIVTVGKTLEDSTCNLMAPLVINIEKMQGRQFILNDTEYTTKHNLFKGVATDVDSK